MYCFNLCILCKNRQKYQWVICHIITSSLRASKVLFYLPNGRFVLSSFLNVIFLEKNVICSFCLAKCITKGQKNCSFWLHEQWLSPQKVQFFLFFSERHLSRKKNVICTFCLAKCIRKGQKNCSFWLHEEWLSPQKEQFFGSFLNVIFLEKKHNLYFLPCQMHQKKTKKKFLLTTWRMALSTKRANFLFLS